MTLSYLFSPLWCDITCTAVFVETIHMHHHDAAKHIMVWAKGSCIIQTKKWYNDREKINLMNVKKTFITAFCWYQFCKNTMGIGIFFCFFNFPYSPPYFRSTFGLLSPYFSVHYFRRIWSGLYQKYCNVFLITFFRIVHSFPIEVGGF